jgi:hypothetical protein
MPPSQPNFKLRFGPAPNGLERHAAGELPPMIPPTAGAKPRTSRLTTKHRQNFDARKDERATGLEWVGD